MPVPEDWGLSGSVHQAILVLESYQKDTRSFRLACSIEHLGVIDAGTANTESGESDGVDLSVTDSDS